MEQLLPGDFRGNKGFRGSAPGPAGGAYGAPPNPLVGSRVTEGRRGSWEGTERERKGNRGKGGEGMEMKKDPLVTRKLCYRKDDCAMRPTYISALKVFWTP